MASDPFRALLEAARASIEAALALYAPEPGPAPRASASCTHPPDQQLEAYVAGKPRQFFCKACQTLINPDASEQPMGGA